MYLGLKRYMVIHVHLLVSNSSSEPPQEAFSLGGCDSSCDTFSNIMADKSNQTSLTAASEVEFRNNLAILDADIAKLQLQFKIAQKFNSQITSQYLVASYVVYVHSIYHLYMITVHYSCI